MNHNFVSEFRFEWQNGPASFISWQNWQYARITNIPRVFAECHTAAVLHDNSQIMTTCPNVSLLPCRCPLLHHNAWHGNLLVVSMSATTTTDDKVNGSVNCARAHSDRQAVVIHTLIRWVVSSPSSSSPAIFSPTSNMCVHCAHCAYIICHNGRY